MNDIQKRPYLIDIQRGLALFWIGVTLAFLVYLWNPESNQIGAAIILLVFSIVSIFFNLRGLRQYQNKTNDQT